jgi:PAS domain S-box-containing protein
MRARRAYLQNDGPPADIDPMNAKTATFQGRLPDPAKEIMFRAVVEQCASGIIIQRDEKLVYANRAALDSIGYSSVDQVRGPLANLFEAKSYATLSPSLRKLTPEDDQLFMGELKLHRRDGALVEAEVYHVCIPGDSDGTTMLNFRDVTMLKRMEHELQQAQKLESVGRLAAGIAHEINTPIQFIGDSAYYVGTALGELLELLERSRAELRSRAEAAGDTAALERFAEEEIAVDLDYTRTQGPRALERIVEGVARVSRIVSAMKCFSHPGTDEASPVDVNKLLSDTLVVAGHELREVGEVSTDLGELPPINGFAGDLNQAFLNLVVNAGHAIADRASGAEGVGRLTVTTRVEDKHVVVRIADNGCGMSPEVQARLFEPFFTTKEVGRGTGQGLTVVHASVVRKHNGTVQFDSAAGVGTTFTVRLPLTQPGT